MAGERRASAVAEAEWFHYEIGVRASDGSTWVEFALLPVAVAERVVIGLTTWKGCRPSPTVVSVARGLPYGR
jgi:hypothetical protein